MESPLRYLSSNECSSAWLKFHLGLPNQSPQRSMKRPNPQQQRNHHQQQQQQHLNTLGLRLNAAGKIKPSVVNMPSMEHRWKIHYSYKTKALTRSINADDAVMVDPSASQRSAREWSRSESGKRSPHDAGRERTSRVRSAASAAVLARGREQQRSPRNRDGTPELVTTTPIRLLGVLRSPEHAPLNWRGNDGQHQPPRYFVFPPVTGSRPGAAPSVRRERRVQASTAPVEARSRSGLEKEDMPMTFSRSSSSESLPSSWKYADGRQSTTTTGSEVTDDRTPHHTSQSTETLVLPTIDEEDAAAASEASHRISVRISRNNSFNNRYNNNWNNNDKRLVESDELRMRVSDNVDEDASDSLSVYDDDSEGDAAEAEWPREPKPSSPVLAITQMDDEGINGNQNEDHIGDQNEDLIGVQNEDHIEDQNENHIGDQHEDHNGDQNVDYIEDQTEANIGDQNEDQIVDQSEDHIVDQDVDHNGNQNEDHIGDQSEDHIGDQNEDYNEDQNSDQNADPSENLNCDQNEHLSQNEKTDSRKCCENDYQEIEAWTKETTDFYSTQRAVYPPLTSRGRASESPPPILRDTPTANESHTAIETMHITDKEQDSPENKVLGEIRQVGLQGVGELVEDWKEVGANDVGSPEESNERRDQDVRDKRDEGDLNRGRQQRKESEEQTVECRNLKDTTDENNNISGIQDRNEVKNGNVETRETSNDTETRIEADSAKVVEFDNPESLAGNVDGVGAESNESNTETVEQLKSIATELTLATDSQSDPGSKENHPLTGDLLDDHGQQQNGASPDLEVEPSFADEKVDGSSVESSSQESTIPSPEERRSPAPTGKAAVARKRSVRFSQDVATVYLYMPVTPTPDDSDTSDSGFLSP